MKSIKTIGLVFNLKRQKSSDQDEEYDEPATITAVKQQIENLGYKVILLEQNRHLFKKLNLNKPDFVFNIAEGIGSQRSRESQVPAILESLNIPYSGSDPISLGITLDKYLTSIILSSQKIPMPQMLMVKNAKDLANIGNIFINKSAYIVKPRWEGSSKGVFNNSLVTNLKQLKARVRGIFSCYHQPAIIEEFLSGDEITVGVYGNQSPRVLGMMKIVPRQKTDQPFIYSLEVKRDWQARVDYLPKKSIARKTQKLIARYAQAAFTALELRDISRIDFRLDKNNIPKIIDINPLPGLSPRYSDLPIICRLNGKSYSYLIKTILKAAISRY